MDKKEITLNSQNQKIAEIISKIDGIYGLVDSCVATNKKIIMLKGNNLFHGVKIHQTRSKININIYIIMKLDVKARILCKTITVAVKNYLIKTSKYSKSDIKIVIFMEGIKNV